MANDYAINYDDKRFTEVEADKKAALSENQKMYSGMIKDSDKYYQAQIDASKQWADKQTQLQQEKTDFAIEKIEQQKDQAKKDYTKEQSGAYVDWQKQSNEYGANAEKAAGQGMLNTGWSESSQTSMYNTYQNRVATARESYNNAILNYDNAIKDAQLQNNSVLAEIAYKALEQQLELSLQGFQYKNNLLLEQANKKLEIDNTYYQRYQDVLAQINQENALAEQIRQYNEEMALKEKQYAESVRQFNASLAEEQRQFNEQMAASKASSSSGGGGGGSSSKSSGSTKKSSGSGTIKKTSTSKTSNHGINRETSSHLKSKSASKEPTLDTKSVIKAGYAGRSGKTIAKAVNEGKLKLTVNGNKATVRPSATAIANSLIFSKTRF